MMFLEGSVMLLVGMWIIRRISRAQTQSGCSGPRPELEYSLKMVELEYQADTQKAELALLEIKEKDLQLAEGRELDRLVATDSHHREQRAKAALIALLRFQGCDENQIESLVKIVDNEPE